MAEKLRVGVIFGGRSGEHAISLLSARSIIGALDPDRYQVVPIAITQEGRWLAVNDAMHVLEHGIRDTDGVRAALLAEPQSRGLVALGDAASAAAASNAVAAAAGGAATSLAVTVRSAVEAGGLAPGGTLDVIFPVLHGTFGEDGTLQGLLEMAGLPYVGSGVAGSATGMDKILMKSIFAAHGFPIVPQVSILRSELEAAPEAATDRVEARLSYPCFVKPANLGSSVGISKAHDRAELHTALEKAARYDRRLVVEQGVEPARELECAVLGNDRPEASVVGEVVPCNEFYDYEAKYVKDDSRLVIPAEVPVEIAERVRRMSCEAFSALDLAGLSRVDFLYHAPSGALFLNEVNTMPGFTRISMYPKLWEASGLPYPRLVDRLIELALERGRDKARTTYRF